MDVSVRDLKARLSEYLRRVGRGEEVVITRRGRPVGRIVPMGEPQEKTGATVVRELRALGWVRAGSGEAPVGARDPLRTAPGQKPLSQVVSEDRG